MLGSIGALRLTVACALLWGSLWALCYPAPQATAHNGVSVSFALEQSSVTLHEPVEVRLAIHNGLSETISFDLGFNRKANLQFIVNKPGGSTVSPPRVSAAGFGRTGAISVESGGTFKQDVLVNEWYQPPAPGSYRIQLKLLDVNLRTESGTSLSSQALSPLMLLRIGPRNPGRLSEVCQSLAQSTRTSPDREKRDEDALALSYVLDPVAIPYLARLAKDPLLGRLAILGLARIANVKGIEQLISRLGVSDPELEESIRSALNGIKLGASVAD